MATSTDPTLRLGINAGATLIGFFASLVMSWTMKLSGESATEVAALVAALATSGSHYIHAWITTHATPN